MRAAARLRWLDAPPRWRAGRAAWDGLPGAGVPSGDDLDRAARGLALTGGVGCGARGDGRSLLRPCGMGDRLAAARYLAALPPVADLDALAAAARAGDASALATLAALLPAEALCRDMPGSPARALVAIGAGAAAPLRALLTRGDLPVAGRALAAMALGALGARGLDLRPALVGPTCTRLLDSSTRPPARHADGRLLIRRAYGLGRAQGMPAAPALGLAFLAVPDGPRLLARLDLAARRAGDYALAPGLLAELLHAGHAPAQLLALAEAAAEVAALVETLAPQPGRRQHQRVRRRHQEFAALIAEQLPAFAQVTGAPDLLVRLARVGRRLIAAEIRLICGATGPVAPEARYATDTVCQLVAAVASVPPHLRRGYLALLETRFDGLLPVDAAPEADYERRRNWLRHRWSQEVLPLAGLLRNVEDLAVAEAALARGAHRAFGDRLVRHPAIARWVLGLIDGFPDRPAAAAGMLLHLVEQCATLPIARATLGPLLGGLFAAPAGLRTLLLERVVSGVGVLLPGSGPTIARVAGLIPLMLRDPARGVPAWYSDVLQAATEFTFTMAMVDGPGWLARLLPRLHRLLAGDDPPAHGLHLGLRLGALAVPLGEELAGAVALAALRHGPWGAPHYAGLKALRRLPGLREALLRLLPQQPRRAMALIAQIGMLRSPGPAALAELPAIGGGALLRSGDAGWGALLALAPAAEGAAAAYLHACWLLGESLALPAGVRAALAQPDRLAEEIAYLERAVAGGADDGRQPADGRRRTTGAGHCRHTALLLRLANLRGRMADPGALWGAAGAEAAERMAQIAAEAQLRASERLLDEGLRARLARQVGPLPPGLPLDDNLRNAALLLDTLAENRDLLVGLLRARLAGDAGWREALPANAAFLADLAARGVRAEDWLGAHAAIYPLPGVAGSRVRVALECDPLHVLQMGNYFETCLSRGGFSAYAAVANAVDCNKRVLYAYDAAGRVIGRKLIGIGAGGRLLGYHTYCRTGSPMADASLRALIQRHLASFAAACGLELGDNDAVPTLVARGWYDDGEVPWLHDTEDLVAPPGPSPTR